MPPFRVPKDPVGVSFAVKLGEVFAGGGEFVDYVVAAVDDEDVAVSGVDGDTGQGAEGAAGMPAP